MSYSKSLSLHSAKDSKRNVMLAYRESPVALVQTRLRGRVMLMPVLDLKDYSCRAVIDWIDVSFQLRRPSQFQFVQRVLEAVTGRRSLVQAKHPGPGNVDTIFNVRFQEPRFDLLQASADAMEAKFGLASYPLVYGVEVSVDFRPTPPSEERRGRMVAVLSRHLFPDRDIITKMADRPRFAWGKGKGQSGHVLKRSAMAPYDGDTVLNPAGDRLAPLDATFYLGSKDAPVMWRVMDKVIDRQRPDEDTWDDLAETEKRVRVEVRLDRLQLIGLGIESLDSFLAFNFARLQGSYFRFMLPTFVTPASIVNAADRHWERERHTRFLNAGIVGLLAMDERRRLLRAANRKALVVHLRTKGAKSAPQPRAGTGASGTLIAYQALNDRVAMALHKLVERERGSLGVE